MSRKDMIAQKARRKSTLKSLKQKKRSRLRQLKNDYEESIRTINIQYSEDPERLKAKYAAEDYAKSEKAKKRAANRISRAREMIEIEKASRKLSVSEEIGSSIVQGLGACIFIAATAILDTIALNYAKNFFTVTAVFYSLFGGSMILMYLFSLLQHALVNLTAKRVFNRLSHVWAFLNIGFGYSAYTITKIQGVQGWVIFGIVWAIAFTGIMFFSISGRRFEKLNIVFYVISGFTGIFACKTLYEVLSTKSFTMLVLGGVFYLVGLIFYNLKKVKYMHLIGNILMLFASIYVFFSLFFINA